MDKLMSRKLAALLMASIFVLALTFANAAEAVILAYLGVAGLLIGGQATIDTFTARNGGPNGKPV